MTVGDCVGEKAILEKSKRTATIVANSDCDLIVMESEYFIKIF